MATFLPCWIYEETIHGRVLARFLSAAGQSVAPRRRLRGTRAERLQAIGISCVSKLWPDFVGVHMVWGSINELTTLMGYRQLMAKAGHPVLTDLLSRITRDESRHFAFYFQQAERRLESPRVARIARFLVDCFWAPVGSGVRPATETRFLAEYLFSGNDGLAAARKVDDTIRRLPGFSDAPLVGAWLGRQASTKPASVRDVTPQYKSVSHLVSVQAESR